MLYIELRELHTCLVLSVFETICVTDLVTTSHCSYRTEMASELGIANLKLTIGSLLACSVDRLSFLVGCSNLGEFLVDSLIGCYT